VISQSAAAVVSSSRPDSPEIVAINGASILRAGTQRLTGGDLDWSADCSPDGNRVIYSSQWEKGSRLMKVSATGGSAVSLLEDSDELGVVSVAHKSQALAIVRKTYGVNDVLKNESGLST
jgi:hypothetical protein